MRRISVLPTPAAAAGGTKFDAFSGSCADPIGGRKAHRLAGHRGVALLNDALLRWPFSGSLSGRIAQLVEQLTLNQRVPGSSPGAPTMQSSGSKPVRPSRTYCVGMATFPHPWRSLLSVSASREMAFSDLSLQHKTPFPAPGGDRSMTGCPRRACCAGIDFARASLWIQSKPASNWYFSPGLCSFEFPAPGSRISLEFWNLHLHVVVLRWR
jgi:hypothetical protein